MAFKTDSENKRKKLPVQTEPHWDGLGRGRALGYRKSEQHGIWKARCKFNGRYLHKTLDDHDNFDDAKLEAEEWFSTITGAGNHKMTVARACAAYIKLKEVDKGRSHRSTNDTRLRLNRLVVPTLGHILLSELTAMQVQNWHLSLVKETDDMEVLRKSKVTANRCLTV